MGKRQYKGMDIDALIKEGWTEEDVISTGDYYTKHRYYELDDIFLVFEEALNSCIIISEKIIEALLNNKNKNLLRIYLYYRKKHYQINYQNHAKSLDISIEELREGLKQLAELKIIDIYREDSCEQHNFMESVPHIECNDLKFKIKTNIKSDEYSQTTDEIRMINPLKK